MIRENTLVYLYDILEKKKYLITLKTGNIFSTHRGVLIHNDIISSNYGEKCFDNHNNAFLILRPNLAEILMNLKRHTQIIYPKDIGYIILKLGARNGDRIIESGTGSGITTVALAYCVHPEGKIYTYDRSQDFSEKAHKNIVIAGMEQYVECKYSEINENSAFDETNVDSVFLDLKDPTFAIKHSYSALKPAGILGILLPTVNQVIDAIDVLTIYPFMEIEVAEILLRNYKINSNRLRPNDSMTRHTGYLVFARKSVI